MDQRDTNNRIIDLSPSEWTTERERLREPFFGPGLPFLFVFIASIVLATVAHEYGPLAQLSAAAIGAVIGSVVNAIYC